MYRLELLEFSSKGLIVVFKFSCSIAQCIRRYADKSTISPSHEEILWIPFVFCETLALSYQFNFNKIYFPSSLVGNSGKSRDQLDKELDQYMAKPRTNDFDSLMN